VGIGANRFDKGSRQFLILSSGDPIWLNSLKLLLQTTNNIENPRFRGTPLVWKGDGDCFFNIL
jgi:hypothetical protein